MNLAERTEMPIESGPESALAAITSTEQALALFDSLDPVSIEFMLGDWKGAGVPTDHPMDGVLEAANWYGKRFESPRCVYPLVHMGLDGKKFCIQPALMPIGLLVRYPSIKTLLNKRLFLLLRPLVGTRHSGARLRMTEFRGVTTATMIYDRQPINDVFRKLDEDTVLGAMDMKEMERPFFFKLQREKPG